MKKILAVIDMQNDFIDGALGTKEAEAIVEAVKEKILGFDGKVIYTLDTHHDDYMNTQEGKYLPVPHCVKNTAGWELNTKIKDALLSVDAKGFEKPTFGSTSLVEFLKSFDASEGIESIEFVGLCTDICVISNALLVKASFPELTLICDPSCCAGVTPDKHEAALETMRSCQIQMA